MLDLSGLENLSEYQEQAIAWAAAYGAQLFLALVILIIGFWISSRIKNIISAALTKRGVDPLLVGFLASVAYYIMLVAVGLAAVSRIGVDTTSFLAIVGSMGLAIGLAMKDNLSNFSSGVVLILFRPFTVGDYIEVAGTAGTVKQITLSNTVLATPDNQRIYVPNTKITGEVIKNVTANETRRIDLVIGIGYGDDIEKAKSVVRGLIEADSRILTDPAPQIAVSELADSSVNLVVRPWVATSEYWNVRFELIENIKLALDENGISIPYPQRDIHMVSQ